MKRKFIKLIFTAVSAILLTVTVCAEDIIHEGARLERVGKEYAAIELVTMSPVSPSISHIELDVTGIPKDEDDYISLSDSFYLQRSENGEWKNIKMLFVYEPRESSVYFGGGHIERIRIPIKSAYGELAEGRYRVIIPMSCPRGSYIDCEFDVSNNGFKYAKEDEYSIKAPNEPSDYEDIVDVEFVGIEIDYPMESADIECEM